MTSASPGLVERLRAGICSDRCRVIEARSGCDCATAADRIAELEAALKLAREVIGAHVEADAHADTMPDDEADAVYLREGEVFWRGKAREWAGPDLLSECGEEAETRQKNDPEMVAAMRAIHAELASSIDLRASQALAAGDGSGGER